MDSEHVLSPRPSALSAVPLATPLVSDDRLAKLAGRGDETAFGVLYKRYHRPLYRYCCSLLRNEADAEDAVQCAFVSALRSLRREQRDVPVRPWLFRIAHNESVSLVRRRRPEQGLPDGCEAHTVPLEEQVEERERLKTLVADLRALGERQRAALLMREMSGLSHKEIALALGVSVDAAKQSVFEARRSLHEFTEGRSMNCDEVRRMISDTDGHRMLRSRRVRAHARHCSECAAFAAAIPERRRRLKALVPGLPPSAAVGLTRGIAGSMGAGDAAGIAAGVGKTVVAGIGSALKAAAITAATAVVATGASIGLPHILKHQPPRRGAIPAVGAVRYGNGAPRAAARVHTANRMISIGMWRANGQPGNTTTGHTGRKGPAGHNGKKDGASSSGQTGNNVSSTPGSHGAEEGGGNESNGQGSGDPGNRQSDTTGGGRRQGSSSDDNGEDRGSTGSTGSTSSTSSTGSNPRGGGNDAANESTNQGASAQTATFAGRVAAQDDSQSTTGDSSN